MVVSIHLPLTRLLPPLAGPVLHTSWRPRSTERGQQTPRDGASPWSKSLRWGLKALWRL